MPASGRAARRRYAAHSAIRRALAGSEGSSTTGGSAQLCTGPSDGALRTTTRGHGELVKTLMSVSELSPLVRSRRSLLAAGWSERALELAVREGRLHTVRRGSYIAADDRSNLWAESRHLAHVIAVARDAAGLGVASHESAGVVWGLPLYRHRPRRVHLTTPAPARISSGPDVMRHVAPLPASDVTVRGGIRCTTLERTVFDMTRTLSAEAAVACADAAERMLAFRGRVWDEDAATYWRRAMAERVAAASGARGVRQARWICGFADGKAQLPGESVSRLQLMRIGFEVPQLQVPVAGPRQNMYFVDFGLRDVQAFGEFDGKGKYVDEAMRRGVSLEKVLLDEKQREDWIRGTTQWKFARWGDDHVATPFALAERLRSFHITPPR